MKPQSHLMWGTVFNQHSLLSHLNFLPHNTIISINKKESQQNAKYVCSSNSEEQQKYDDGFFAVRTLLQKSTLSTSIGSVEIRI